MKLKVMYVAFLTFSASFNTVSLARHAPHDPNENHVELGWRHHHAELEDLIRLAEREGKSSESEKEIYSVESLIQRLKYQNFDLRINAERVYQARKNIDVQIGSLLPSLNFGNIIAAAEMNFFDLVPSLLGFIYPSNWFRWQESKLFFQAERWGHVTMTANQVNALMAEIYQVAYIRGLIVAYQGYTAQMRELAVQSRLRLELGEGRLDACLSLENLVILLEEDLAALKTSYRNLKYQIAFVVNLDEKIWNNFEIEALNLPDLRQIQTRKPVDLLNTVLDVSPEKKQIEYLIEASKFSTRTRMFDFLNPVGGNDTSLGFGYISQIQIGKSQTRVLNTQKDELISNLKLSVYRSVENLNLAIRNHRQFDHGLHNSEQWFDFLQKRFYEGGEYEASEFIESIESMLEFHSKTLLTRLNYLVSEEVLQRLMLRGDRYDRLLELTPSKPYKKFCLIKGLENKKIKKAKKKGTLTLDI